MITGKDRRERIEEEIERTMQLLDSKEPAETDPFFFTRLQARLGRQKEIAAPSWIRQNIPLALVAALLVAANSFLIYRQFKTVPAVTSSQQYEALATEYQLDVNSSDYYLKP
jgi:hypothetical protein